MLRTVTGVVATVVVLAGCAPTGPSRLALPSSGPYSRPTYRVPVNSVPARYPVNPTAQTGNYGSAQPPVPVGERIKTARELEQEIPDTQRRSANGDYNASMRLGRYYSDPQNAARSLRNAETYLAMAVQQAPNPNQKMIAQDLLDKTRTVDKAAWNAADPNKSTNTATQGPSFGDVVLGVMLTGVAIGVAAQEAGLGASSNQSTTSSSSAPDFFEAGQKAQREATCRSYAGESGSVAEVARGLNNC
jgi:hypothetical protein